MISVDPLEIPTQFDLNYRAASIAARFYPGSDRSTAREVYRNVNVLEHALNHLTVYIGGPLLDHLSVREDLMDVFLLEKRVEVSPDSIVEYTIRPDNDGNRRRFTVDTQGSRNQFRLGYLEVAISEDRLTARDESSLDFLRRATVTAETQKENEDWLLKQFDIENGDDNPRYS